MILEDALLDVLPDKTDGFERAFAEASGIMSSAPGYLSQGQVSVSVLSLVPSAYPDKTVGEGLSYGS